MLKFLSRILPKRIDWQSTANFQAEYDTLHHFLLTQVNLGLIASEEPGDEPLDINEIDLPNLLADLAESNIVPKHNVVRQSKLQDALETQIRKMYDVVDENPYNSAPPPLNLNQVEKSSHDEKLDQILLKDEEYVAGKEIFHPQNYSLQVKKSKIDHPSSGYGLFVKSGRILPGSVICFYPGEIFRREKCDPKFSPRDKITFDYCIGRYDGYIMDAYPWIHKVHEVQRKFAQFSLLNVEPTNHTKYAKYFNQFAVGHFINHPEKDSKPNCVNQHFNFSTSWPQEAKDLTPYTYAHKIPIFLDMMQGNHFAKGVVIIASEFIEEGEEIKLNYRYNPDIKSPKPDWYFDCNVDEARRRWQKFKPLKSFPFTWKK